MIDELPVGIAGSALPTEGPPGIDLRAVDGRLPGRRGLATRQRLLAATATLLETTGYRDLKVVEVAREAGTSPATFYQYFPDAESAVLVLAAELTEAWHDELAALVADCAITDRRRINEWKPFRRFFRYRFVALGFP